MQRVTSVAGCRQIIHRFSFSHAEVRNCDGEEWTRFSPLRPRGRSPAHRQRGWSSAGAGVGGGSHRGTPGSRSHPGSASRRWMTVTSGASVGCAAGCPCAARVPASSCHRTGGSRSQDGIFGKARHRRPTDGRSRKVISGAASYSRLQALMTGGATRLPILHGDRRLMAAMYDAVIRTWGPTSARATA